MTDLPDLRTPGSPEHSSCHDAEVVRAFLLTYCRDRLGRDAPVGSRALAHDALDRLERGGA